MYSVNWLDRNITVQCSSPEAVIALCDAFKGKAKQAGGMTEGSGMRSTKRRDDGLTPDGLSPKPARRGGRVARRDLVTGLTAQEYAEKHGISLTKARIDLFGQN